VPCDFRELSSLLSHVAQRMGGAVLRLKVNADSENLEVRAGRGDVEVEILKADSHIVRC
jgi:hypothetical protein